MFTTCWHVLKFLLSFTVPISSLQVSTFWVPWNNFFFILPLRFLQWVIISHSQQFATAYLICFFSTSSSTVTVISERLCCSSSIRRVLQCDSLHLPSQHQFTSPLQQPAAALWLLSTPCHPSALWLLAAPATYEKSHFGLIAFCGALSKWIQLSTTTTLML